MAVESMRTIATFVLLLCAAVSQAATVRVLRDGTGDFTTIQLGLNAAADGDTVYIGPGDYTESAVVMPPGWTTTTRTFGVVYVRELTIIGAGEGLTVIGPVSYAWDASYGPQGLIVARMDHDLRISDLTIRNCYDGLYFRGTLSMQRCELRSNYTGLRATLVDSGNQIDACHISGIAEDFMIGIYTRTTNASLAVENCEFIMAEAYVQNSNTTFQNCRFEANGVGISVMNGAHGQVRDCDIVSDRVGLTTYLGWPPSHCDVFNSRIAGTFEAILVDHLTSMSVEGSVLTGGSNAVVYAYNAQAIAIHGCDFVKGSGPVVLARRPAALGAVAYDLANNFWGTADESQVQEWIVDSHDDFSICATVLYSPFSGQSVPTESTTWGELKARFR